MSIRTIAVVACAALGLAACGGNRAAAARSLGVGRATLYRYLRPAPGG